MTLLGEYRRRESPKYIISSGSIRKEIPGGVRKRCWGGKLEKRREERGSNTKKKSHGGKKHVEVNNLIIQNRGGRGGRCVEQLFGVSGENARKIEHENLYLFGGGKNKRGGKEYLTLKG